MVKSTKPVALVTGASSGIGAAYAERLARDGYDLIVVARRRGRLEELADRLRGEHSSSVRVLDADLGDAVDLRRVAQACARQSRLEFVVNSAGFGGYKPFVELTAAEADQLIALHVTAITRLTRASLAGMVERGRRAIVNVASLLAFSASLPAPPLPNRAVYAAAKSYIVTFSEIVASEVANSGVHVQALCPGVVETEFHGIVGADVSHIPAMSPEDVVQASLAGLRLREVICAPGVADANAVRTYTEARTVLMGSALSRELAPRYREPE